MVLKRKTKTKATLPSSAQIINLDAVKKPLIEQVIDFTGAPEIPVLNQQYRDIAGLDRPMDELTSANREELNLFSKDLSKVVRKYLRKNKCDAALVVERIGVTSGNAPVFETPHYRKCLRAPKRNVDMIAGFRSYPWPSDNPDRLFDIVIESVRLIFGPEARAALSPGRPKKRRRVTVSENLRTVTWLDASNRKDIQNAIDMIVKPTLTVPADRRDSLLERPPEWIGKEAGLQRALVMFVSHSLMPWAKTIVAANTGRSLLAGVQATSDQRLNDARKVRPASVHRDAIIQLWGCEYVRMGMIGFRVPVVKLR